MIKKLSVETIDSKIDANKDEFSLWSKINLLYWIGITLVQILNEIREYREELNIEKYFKLK